MKTLLINSSLLQATTGQYKKTLEKERGIYSPIGLAYIAAVLEKNNHQVKIIDCDAQENYEGKIKDTLKIFKPEIVGFYAMTWNFALANKMAGEIKKDYPKIITVLGGPNVTTMPEVSLRFGNFDFGVMGEGEETIVELFKKIENKINIGFEKILGLVYKKEGQIFINPPRPLIQNLDLIPFPARHLLPMEKYSDIFTKSRRFSTIFATRGCPFNCTFCDRKNRMGRNWRFRSPQNIAQEIRQVIDTYGIREFMFFDDNLIVDKTWAYQLMAEIKKLGIIWECRERVDMVDEPMLKAMKEAGCYRIRFGFESGSNEILNILKKGITRQQSLECARLCKKIGIEIFGYFIIGAPGETPETIQKTIDLALKINPSFALFSKMILIPSSEIFEYAVSTGQIAQDFWEKFIKGEEMNGAPSFTKEKLSEKEIESYVQKANKKFYFRLRFIGTKILEIKSFAHLLKQIKIGLALILKNK